MKGIILAGGKATRLGPLAAQLNKSLVTVGQKPQLVRQVQQLKGKGCDEIVVVVSPGSADQVDCVIARAGLEDVRTAVQLAADGPADAVRVGLENAFPRRRSIFENYGSVIVLMSDTVLQDHEIPSQPDTIAVGSAPARRAFCARSGLGSPWRDGEVRQGWPVAVGAYCFKEAAHLLAYCYNSGKDADTGEYGMATLLNAYERQYPLRDVEVVTWQDVGDVAALARANRRHFIARSFNDLELGDDGLIVKRGADLEDEAHAMAHPPEAARQLYPRVYGHGDDYYAMEHVDLPSLAELWLYWPSRPDMWSHITTELVRQLEKYHWPAAFHPSINERAHEMYVTKLQRRYVNPGVPAWGFDEVTINGETFVAGRRLLDWVIEHVNARIVPTSMNYAGIVHGDPNFTNVLWSLRTGNFKLLDARGNWGGPGSYGDTRYDVAKIAYSSAFAPIVHGLYTLEGDGSDWQIEFWPDRDAEIVAMTRELAPYCDPEDLAFLVGHMLLSGAPLHNEHEANAMYLTAVAQLNTFFDIT